MPSEELYQSTESEQRAIGRVEGHLHSMSKTQTAMLTALGEINKSIVKVESSVSNQSEDISELKVTQKEHAEEIAKLKATKNKAIGAGAMIGAVGSSPAWGGWIKHFLGLSS